ncbi:MAG TPA: hypothetical protein VFR37_21220 [Longimicrobium sp.]|nr:hypothetical protein [Longimicrobium sp.]
MKTRSTIDTLLQDVDWRLRPESVVVGAELSGGRSGCLVMELRVQHPTAESMRVMKAGAIGDLRQEYSAWQSHIDKAGHSTSRLFAAISEVTPNVVGRVRSSPLEGEWGAIIYDHARQALHGESVATFESFAREAILAGGEHLDRARDAIGDLLAGLGETLYARPVPIPREHKYYEYWNTRLGVDLVVEVDTVRKAFLSSSEASAEACANSRVNPLEVLAMATEPGRCNPGTVVSMLDVEPQWWRGRLFARRPADPTVMIELVHASGSGMDAGLYDRLASSFGFCGKVRSTRAAEHRSRLVSNLATAGVRLANGVAEDEGVRVPDPFPLLPRVLNASAAGRFLSVVHGDLNPRNVLVVGLRDGYRLPCLIDYALTDAGQPLLFDFVKLELCLLRDALPPVFTWSDHVRLQRLLAVVSMTRGHCHERAVRRLRATPRVGAKLSRAFELLWTVRAKALAAYPEAARSSWWQDYAESLFLFAHSVLKWECVGPDAELPATLASDARRPPAATQCWVATAAALGVAAECLEPGRFAPPTADRDLSTPFDFWSAKELRRDGRPLAAEMLARPESCVSELAWLCRAMQRRRIPIPDLADTRRSIAATAFRETALEAKHRREAEHGLYMQLPAYMRLRGRLGRESSVRDVIELVRTNEALVLLGDAGGGKTTVAREWEYLLAQAVAEGAAREHARLPLVLPAAAVAPFAAASAMVAPQVVSVLRDGALAAFGLSGEAPSLRASIESLSLERLADLLTLGVFHVTLDGLNEVVPGSRPAVASWIVRLRQLFPETPVLVTHRRFNFDYSLLPFPVVNLQEVEEGEVTRYIETVFRDRRTQGQALISALFGTGASSEVRQLAQTPLFVWMITRVVMERSESPTEVLTGRGRLFDTFSRWHLEQRSRAESGQQPYPYRHATEDKLHVLTRMGDYVVSETSPVVTLESVRRLVPEWDALRCEEVLSEIVDSHMLAHGDEGYAFLHQSFAEYFAALHFFHTAAHDEHERARRVREYRWHETLVMLVGFADADLALVHQVVLASLRVDPVLTARILRAAEYPDPETAGAFIDEIRRDLRDPRGGSYRWRLASEALQVLGSDAALGAMLDIGNDRTAPVGARAEVIRHLARAVLGRAGAHDAVHDGLIRLIRRIVDSDQEASAVVVAAVDAIVSGGLSELEFLLAGRTQAPAGEVREAAWRAVLKLRRFPSRKEVRERLDELERDLLQQTEGRRISERNEERVELLRNLAEVGEVCSVLLRRFAFGIDDEVRRLVDELVLPASAAVDGHEQPSLEVLRGPASGGEQEARALADLVSGAELCSALAAGHRLAGLGSRVPPGVLAALLDQPLEPARRRIVAVAVAASRHAALARPVESVLRRELRRVSGPGHAEAWAQLHRALGVLDRQRARRLWAVAAYLFYDRYMEEARPYRFPLVMLDKGFACTNEDHEFLLASDHEDDRRAAVYDLSFLGLGALLKGRPSPSLHLGERAKGLFCEMAEAEQNATWQARFACAAAAADTVELLPWLMRIAEQNPRLREGTNSVYDLSYGRIEEMLLAVVLRAIGLLARRLHDDGPAHAAEAIRYLDGLYGTDGEGVDRGIVVGLATGLGYLGRWTPILSQVGRPHPYLEEVANSVFTYWLPHGPPGIAEREAAAAWMHMRRTQPDVPASGKDILNRLHDGLCRELGRFIDAG